MLYEATMVTHQGWKCVPSLKAKPLPSGVVRIHPSLRGRVDVLGSVKCILMCGASGLSDGALHPLTHGIAHVILMTIVL